MLTYAKVFYYSNDIIREAEGERQRRREEGKRRNSSGV
jgi:hypothetical protein